MKIQTGNSEQAPEGVHFARLLGITNMGHQPEWEWQGEMQPSSYQVELTYELVNSAMKDGRPFVISESVKASSSDKSTLFARAQVLGIDVAAFAEGEGLGNPASVTVAHKNGKARINGKAGVTGVPVGIPVAELTNPTYFFDMDKEDVDVDYFLELPEWKRERIQSALDFPETPLAKKLAERDQF